MLNNKIKRGYKSQETIFHSDQGTVYSSVAFNNVHKDYNIARSMSRIGTPTDNQIIESKNGWLKKEMYIDFNQEDYKTVDINSIIYDHNYLSSSYALNYPPLLSIELNLDLIRISFYCLLFIDKFV